MYPESFHNQRQSVRVPSRLPIQLSFGTQITVQGQLKDLSLKSAFVVMKTSLYLQPQEELKFIIQRSRDNSDASIEGIARISRIADGGIAIYFTEMEDISVNRLKELVEPV